MISKDLTLKGLEVFQAVAKLGSIQAVAEETGLSISTVSHHLKALENGLGVSLVGALELAPECHVTDTDPGESLFCGSPHVDEDWANVDLWRKLPEWLNEHRCDDPTVLGSALAGGLLVEELRPLDISSTEIRDMLVEGRSARYLLPEPVLDYIQERHLYQ